MGRLVRHMRALAKPFLIVTCDLLPRPASQPTGPAFPQCKRNFCRWMKMIGARLSATTSPGKQEVRPAELVRALGRQFDSMMPAEWRRLFAIMCSLGWKDRKVAGRKAWRPERPADTRPASLPLFEVA